MQVLTQLEVLEHSKEKFLVLVDMDKDRTDTKVGVRIHERIEAGNYIPYYIEELVINYDDKSAKLRGRNFISGVKLDLLLTYQGTLSSSDGEYLAFDADEVMEFLANKARKYRDASDMYKSKCKSLDDLREDLYSYRDLAKL